MLKRVGALLAEVSVFAGLLGCVSLDAYQLKEQEVQLLSSVNEEMRGRNQALRDEKTGLESRVGEMNKENEGLVSRLQKQNKQIVFLQNWGERLEKDSDGLRTQVEKLNSKISTLSKENQRLTTLSLPENLLRSLGDRFANLQKQVEALSGENQKLKSRQAAMWTEEEKLAPAEDEKVIESGAEKPQPVMVSSGPKGEESEGYIPPNEREQAALPEDRIVPVPIP